MSTTTSSTLYARLVACIQRAALHGWTPRDLSHVFGPRMVHLLHREGDNVVGILRPPHQDTWKEELCSLPASPPAVPQIDLEFLYSLMSLSPMNGADYLRPASRLTSPGKEGDHAAKHRATIEKLLAKARSTSFPEEAESLIAKAQELQQRYRISLLDGDGHGPESPSMATGVRAQRVYLHAPWIRHQFLLLGAIARCNGCRAILIHSKGIANVLGLPQDIDATLHLFGCLNHLRDHFMRHSEAALEAARQKDTNSFRRSFCLAFAVRIEELLRAANDDVWDSPEQRNSMLPVLQQREKAVATTVSFLYPSLSSTRITGSSMAGHTAGRAAADRAYRSTRFPALGRAA